MTKNASNNPRKILAQIAAESKASADEVAKQPSAPLVDTANADDATEAVTAPVSSDAHSSESSNEHALNEDIHSSDARNSDAPDSGSSNSGTFNSNSLDSSSLDTLSSSQQLSGKPKKRETDKRIKPANDERRRKQRRKRRLRIARNTTIVVLLLAIIGTIAGFWIFRWEAFDDAQDIQGDWRISGTDTVIRIDGEHVVLTDEIAYSYVIDPESKTLSFEFGALDGNARYRFSLDRQKLAIEDGEFDGFATLSADIPWVFNAVLDELQGKQPADPAFSDDGITLERTE